MIKYARELYRCNTNSALAEILFEYIKPISSWVIDSWDFEAYEIIKPIHITLIQHGGRWQARFEDTRTTARQTHIDAIESLKFQIYSIVDELDFVGKLESHVLSNYVAPGKSCVPT